MFDKNKYRKEYMKTEKWRVMKRAIDAHRDAVKRCHLYGGKVVEGDQEALKDLYRMVKKTNIRSGLHGTHPDAFVLDHKVCLADGGDHSIENVQIISFRENQMKESQRKAAAGRTGLSGFLKGLGSHPPKGTQQKPRKRSKRKD